MMSSSNSSSSSCSLYALPFWFSCLVICVLSVLVFPSCSLFVLFIFSHTISTHGLYSVGLVRVRVVAFEVVVYATKTLLTGPHLVGALSTWLHVPPLHEGLFRAC